MKIADVADINARSLQKKFSFQEIEYIDISSVGTGVLNSAPIVLNLGDAPDRARRLVRPGDTIISTVRPNRRSFLYLKSPSGNTVVSTGFAVVSPKEQVDPRYLYYWISRPEFSEYLAAHAKGAAYPAVAAEDIGAAEIDLPAMSKQQGIVSVLSSYDDLINNNNQRVKILEKMTQALYREWFVDFRFPEHSGSSFVASKIGQVPRGWEVRRMGDAFRTVLGGTPSRAKPEFWDNGTIPWINSGKTNDLRVIAPSEMITRSALDKSATKLMPPGTTILAITGATLGQVSYLEIETAANQSVVGIIDESATLNEWLYLTVSERIQSIIMHASGGAQQHINKEVVNDVLVALPPKEIAIRFQQVTRPLFRLMANLLFQIQGLRRTRDLLIPQLLAGKISAPEAILAHESLQ
jgi:type I restriction enzyme S subunit